MEDLHRLIAEKCLLKYKQISRKNASSDGEWSPLAAVALVQNSCSGKQEGVIMYREKAKTVLIFQVLA